MDKVYDNLQEITGTSVRPIQVSEDDSGTPNGAGDPDYEDMSEESEEDTDSEDDVQNMSGPGESPTESDKRIMARYIASFDDWDALSNREKWGAFEQMVSLKACPTEQHANCFRSTLSVIAKLGLNCIGLDNEVRSSYIQHYVSHFGLSPITEVNRLVRKYQLRKEKQQSIHRQVGRPTWAKRSRLDVDDSGARDSKRSRDSGGYQ